MQPRKFLLSACTLGAMLFAIPGIAADLLRQGTDNFTNVWVMTSNSMHQDARTFTTWELNGVARNDSGGPMFNLFGVRCIGLWQTPGKESSNDHGTCTYTDKDGDNIFATFGGKNDDNGAERGVYDLVGGTGKFASITGTGEYVNSNTPIKADDKVIRGVVSVKISWKLP